jgi:putative transposase
MARLPRLIIPHQPHLVTQRGHDQQAIFRDGEDYRIFLQSLRDAIRQYGVALHAYVFLPNHMHLLVSPGDAQGLGKMLQWLGRCYVPYFNHKYQRTGSLWQGRYKTTVVDAASFLLPCMHYVELDPVRTGLVTDPGAYGWSSYAHHAGITPDPHITDHPLYWQLGNTPFEREVTYRLLVEQALGPNQFAMLEQGLGKGWAVGSTEFKAMLEKQVQRRVQPAKRGRPAKGISNPS